MKRHSNRLIAAVAMIVLLLAGADRLAAQDDSSLIDRLNLTAEQQEDFRKIKTDFLDESSSIRDAIKGLLAEERQLRKSGAGSQQLKGKMEERAEKEIELTLLLNQFRKDVMAILTPEQRRRLEELRSQ